MNRRTLSAAILFSQVVSFFQVPTSVQAEITNPNAGIWGKGSAFAKNGTMTAGLFVLLWNAIMIAGGLMVLYYFILGSVEWISSEGDKGKLQKARDKMLHAFIGMLILVASYTILEYMGTLVFQGTFDILSPTIYTPQ